MREIPPENATEWWGLAGLVSCCSDCGGIVYHRHIKRAMRLVHCMVAEEQRGKRKELGSWGSQDLLQELSSEWPNLLLLDPHLLQVP